MGEEILSMKGISKIYSNGIAANDQVDFSVNAGEIHALMGENGAGKSTLMKILFGFELPDEGEIHLYGNKVIIPTPTVAINLGIGMVHQHFMLVPSLTVAENLILGMAPTKHGLLDSQKAVQITRDIAKKYNFSIDPMAKVESLSVGNKQKLEILKALVRGAKILILDEPTAVLTPQETNELFEELLLLKNNGHTIIFISHKLAEIKAICDRITVIRRGKLMGVKKVSEVSQADISKLMVGRDVILHIDKSPAKIGETILQVNDLSYIDEEGKQLLKPTSFILHKGEILGVAGVEGNGQRQMVESLTGMAKPSGGSISVSGIDVSSKTIHQIRNLHVAHIPEDRMTYGVAAQASITENILSDRIAQKEYNNFFTQKTNIIKKISQDLIQAFKIKCSSPDQLVGMLSGGNIQKVVVAREFSSNPALLVADQPTRGVDVGATEFIHRKLVELRDNGAGILLISADLNEVMELSDSIIVMYDGRIVAYFSDSQMMTEEDLGMYMLGIKEQSKSEIRSAMYGE